MHRIIKKAKAMNKNELKELILERYSNVCGDFGRKIFEGKVLPKAFEVYEDSSELVMKLYGVIQVIRECKTQEIDEYLLNVFGDLEKQLT